MTCHHISVAECKKSSHLLGGGLSTQLLQALGTDLHTVVGLVPGSEGGSINLDDAVLHKGLGADQLVVRGVVHDIKDTGLFGRD